MGIKGDKDPVKKKGGKVKRTPITEIKDKRSYKYKAGKEVGYWEALVEVWQKKTFKKAGKYIKENKKLILALCKENKDDKGLLNAKGIKI